MNSGRYGRLFARAMQFRQQRCLHLEQIRYQLTDKIEKESSLLVKLVHFRVWHFSDMARCLTSVRIALKS
jgi:hypothetical protein